MGNNDHVLFPLPQTWPQVSFAHFASVTPVWAILQKERQDEAALDVDTSMSCQNLVFTVSIREKTDWQYLQKSSYIYT